MTRDAGEQPAYDSMAELVFAVDLGTKAATFDALFEWLLDHVPELNEAWSAALRDLGGGLTLLDVTAIHRAVGGRVHCRTMLETASKLFELHPQTREMWAQLRQTARDTGLLVGWPQGALRAAAYHRGLAELLASDDPESLLSGCSFQQANAYLSILEHRLQRGEGDVERVRRLRDTLRQKLGRNDYLGLAELLVSDDPESLLSGCSFQQAEAYLPTFEHWLQRWEGDIERVRRLQDVLRQKLGREVDLDDEDDGKP